MLPSVAAHTAFCRRHNATAFGVTAQASRLHIDDIIADLENGFAAVKE